MRSKRCAVQDQGITLSFIQLLEEKAPVNNFG